jgi:hypothetical protein
LITVVTVKQQLEALNRFTTKKILKPLRQLGAVLLVIDKIMVIYGGQSATAALAGGVFVLVEPITIGRIYRMDFEHQIIVGCPKLLAKAKQFGFLPKLRKQAAASLLA